MSEARLLSVYFEESSLYNAEMVEDSRRGSRSSSSYTANDYGMETDNVIGGDDEIDAFEAQKRARRQRT